MQNNRNKPRNHKVLLKDTVRQNSKLWSVQYIHLFLFCLISSYLTYSELNLYPDLGTKRAGPQYMLSKNFLLLCNYSYHQQLFSTVLIIVYIYVIRSYLHVTNTWTCRENPYDDISSHLALFHSRSQRPRSFSLAPKGTRKVLFKLNEFAQRTHHARYRLTPDL